MLAVDVVEEGGFVALEASDADEAVVLLEACTDICLVFTDINMPGTMDGLRLAHAVRDRWSTVKILVVSGQMRPGQADLPPNARFIEKPYRAALMVEELRLLVGSPISVTVPPSACS